MTMTDTPTSVRNFRCPDALWDQAAARSAEEGEPVSEVLRRALEAYIVAGAPERRTTLTVEVDVEGYPPRITEVRYA